MADNISISPGTGAVVSTEDIGGGVQVQQVKPVFGAHGSATDVDAAHGLPVAAQYVEYTGTAISAAVVIGPVDTRTYQSYTLTRSGGSVNNAFIVEGSNDSAIWDYVGYFTLGSQNNGYWNSGQNGATTTMPWAGALYHRWLRIRCSAYVSGTTALTLELFARPLVLPYTATSGGGAYPQVQIGSSSTVYVGSGGPSAPQYAQPTVAAEALWNGTNYDHQRTANAAQGTTGTGVPGAANLYFDGTNYQRVTPSAPLPVTIDTGTLLNRIEQLEMTVRQLLAGAGGQFPDAVGRTRVLVDSMTANLALGSVGTVTTVSTVNKLSQIGSNGVDAEQVLSRNAAALALRDRIQVS